MIVLNGLSNWLSVSVQKIQDWYRFFQISGLRLGPNFKNSWMRIDCSISRIGTLVRKWGLGLNSEKWDWDWILKNLGFGLGFNSHYLDYIIKFIQGQNGRWHDWASFRFDKWVNGDHVWSRDVLYFLAWDSGCRWIRRQTADRGRMELSFRKFHDTIDVWQK